MDSQSKFQQVILTDAKVYCGRRKTQNGQHNIKGEVQSLKTDTIRFQDFL